MIAASSDFLDGIVARRGRGATRHGAVLDNVADIAFVLAGTGTGAALGLVPRAAPVAIAIAFAVYAVASIDRSARERTWRVARSRLGHAAGVLNYGLAALVAGAVAVPGAVWRPTLAVAGAAIVAVNLGAVLERALPWGARPAPGTPGGGRAAR